MISCRRLFFEFRYFLFFVERRLCRIAENFEENFKEDFAKEAVAEMFRDGFFVFVVVEGEF